MFTMALLRIVLVLIFVSAVNGFQVQEHFVPQVSAAKQEAAVKALILRTLGEDAARKFTIELDSTLTLRSFKLSTANNEGVSIIGSDGVSVAKGFHHYLKYYLGKDITWRDTQANLTAYAELPKANLYSVSASSVIYYQNVCTWSYSFAWWSWSLWRRHIDWMAMMGISFTIAPVQEYVWHDVYLGMGLNESEIAEHFAGPAFQAWQRMGNLRAWAGPLSATYRSMQTALQKSIIEAQRELGMVVALPAFAGHVPRSMARLYPNVNFTSASRWCNFPDIYCCPLFVEPTEPLFHEIGVKFLARIIATYGTNHIYFCDPFNELEPKEKTTSYINRTSFHIYDTMRAVDKTAVWLLQGWMFVNSHWDDELIKAFLTAVPQGHLLVLDLMSEQKPWYMQTHSFYGQPFIWCMLHNFGGTLGMHGAVEVVNTRIRLARNMSNSTMVGVGITPEGIHQNYVMYALALERAWMQDDFDLEQWFNNYADVQYGVKDVQLRTAWQLLRTSAYSYYGDVILHGQYTITQRPSLELKPWTWFNQMSIQQAGLLFLIANVSEQPGSGYANYQHDLVDITRQFLQGLWDRLYINLMASFEAKDLPKFTQIADKLVNLLDDMESILATNVHFILGPWLQCSRALADNTLEEQLYEMNARNQITIWGPKGQIRDYATKQWSGIVRDYYRPRWELFLQQAQKSLEHGTKFNRTAFEEKVENEIEIPFSTQLTKYPTEAVGNTFEIANRIFNKWISTMNNAQFKDCVPLEVEVEKVMTKFGI